MNENYIAYSYMTGNILACHSNLTIITDYLHISQPDNYIIAPISKIRLFEELETVSLFRLYLQLGGNKEQFKTAKDILASRIRLLESSRRLAVLYPQTEINGFEVKMQAAWIDGLDDKCGYQYRPGSHIPRKISSG